MVIGASGIIGNAVVNTLAGRQDWTVRALRRTQVAGVHSIDCDLANPAEVALALRAAADTAHVFYAAYKPEASAALEASVNTAMLAAVLDGLKAVGAPLQRVVHYQGAKVYGPHLGAAVAPFYEDDARHLAPNFYFDQEDLLRERASAGEFDWSILRPDAVIGDIGGNPMNIAVLIVWAALSDNARNEAFNLVGEPFRWERIWKRVGAALDIEVAEPQPMSLATHMPAQAAQWTRLAAQHDLQPIAYPKLVNWFFGDVVFNIPWDMVSDMGKIRRAGFTEAVSTEDALVQAILSLKLKGILP